MTKRETIEFALAMLVIASAAIGVCFYYSQIKLLCEKRKASIVTFLILCIGMFVWGCVKETLVPVACLAILVTAFFVTLHRGRRRRITTIGVILAMISSLLYQQTCYAASGGFQVVTQKVVAGQKILHSSEFLTVYGETEAEMIEKAIAAAIAECAEQGIEAKVKEVKVVRQRAGVVGDVLGFVPAAGLLPVVVIIVVLIVVGWVVIRIIRACRRLPARQLPEESPPPIPPLAFAPAAAGTFHAALSSYAPGYDVCTETRETNTLYSTFELSGEVTVGESNSLTMVLSGSKYLSASASVPFTNYAASLKLWGIPLTTDPPLPGVTMYARDGVLLTTPQGLPVTLSGNQVTIRNPEAIKPNLKGTIEFSRDLKSWYPLVELDLPEGQKFKIQDSGVPMAFYRFKQAVAP